MRARIFPAVGGMVWRALWIALLLVSMLGPRMAAQAAEGAQANAPEVRARALLSTLTPEERVGQLFLVSFQGTDISSSSAIYDLIHNYHIGGVVLSAENDNFSAPGTLDETYALTSGLQNIAWMSSLETRTDAATGKPHRHAYIPLWVGVTQLGGGPPQDQIFSGLSALPSPMALGATWDVDLARQVGQVVGDELWKLGFNMYLGPSLDVLLTPDAARPGDPGQQVFGGDPFWVGRLGQAFIAGLHGGSDGHLLVVASHFPGRGVIDRDPREEIPTVRRSLAQLTQVELMPFAMVSGRAPDEASRADGVWVSNIRYQGFQGNIRATTRPVSLDAQSLALIFGLEDFSSWRDAGGLLVSDELGTQAVQRFYDPRGGAFNAALVARDAFLAGNDLLYMGNIRSSASENTHDTLVAVLAYFAQKYREDQVFAEQVDDAALRILAAKYKTYPYFIYGSVAPSIGGLKTIGQSALVLQAAREGATLISPSLDMLDDVMGDGPKTREAMVFITDTQAWQQCSACSPQIVLGRNDFAQAVLRLYGGQSGAQIYAMYLKSYTFEDVSQLLDGQQVDLTADLLRAKWVVLATAMDVRGETYRIVQRFLTERQDLVRDKKVILFNFGVPYVLDSTDLSKLTAYYNLYTLSPAYVETAVRLLFQELIPAGFSPVSVPGIGYDMMTVTSPDPHQILSLTVETANAATSVPEDAMTPSAITLPNFHVGDTVTVQTGQIVDHNGHIVPDGTVVHFTVLRPGEGGGIFQQVDSETVDGVAGFALRLDKPGLLEITASSEPAMTSVTLQMDVSDEGASLMVIHPTPVFTATLEASTPTAAAAAETPAPPAAGLSARAVWGGGLAAVFLLSGLLFVWGKTRYAPREIALRALSAVFAGLALFDSLLWLTERTWSPSVLWSLLALAVLAGWLAASFLMKREP